MEERVMEQGMGKNKSKSLQKFLRDYTAKENKKRLSGLLRETGNRARTDIQWVEKE